MKPLLIVLACFAHSTVLRAEETGRQILAEINLARTQPQAYAEIVARSEGGSREAVRFLQRAKPLPALGHSPGLAQAAQSHVGDQGASGGFGHVNTFQRIARYGEWLGAAGENIDYGRGGVRASVVRLIVDEGVLGKKHRANIFSKSFRVAGIAAGPHARYGAMCVMDFAGDFIERGSRFAAR